MNLKTIPLRKNLNPKNLRNYLFKFFRKTKFNSQYIYLLTKLSADSSKTNYFLSGKVLLDVTNMSEKTTYVNILENTYLKNEDKYKTMDNKNIMIFYLETDRESYVKYINKLSLSKNFDIEIEGGVNPILASRLKSMNI